MLLFQFVDAEGIVNEDLPNSWECPECVKEGYNKEYKVSTIFVAPALFAINLFVLMKVSLMPVSGNNVLYRAYIQRWWVDRLRC